MVDWTIHQDKNQVNRIISGESKAESDDELLADMGELWRKLFAEHLPWYNRKKWNSVLGTVQVWHGNVSLSPCLDLDICRQTTWCGLYLRRFHSAWESIENNEESETVAEQQQHIFVHTLVKAFEAVRAEPAVRSILDSQPLPFKILIEPDEPPVVETVLQ